MRLLVVVIGMFLYFNSYAMENLYDPDDFKIPPYYSYDPISGNETQKIATNYLEASENLFENDSNISLPSYDISLTLELKRACEKLCKEKNITPLDREITDKNLYEIVDYLLKLTSNFGSVFDVVNYYFSNMLNPKQIKLLQQWEAITGQSSPFNIGNAE